jgi:Flp pilus assembly protein TadD
VIFMGDRFVNIRDEWHAWAMKNIGGSEAQVSKAVDTVLAFIEDGADANRAASAAYASVASEELRREWIAWAASWIGDSKDLQSLAVDAALEAIFRGADQNAAAQAAIKSVADARTRAIDGKSNQYGSSAQDSVPVPPVEPSKPTEPESTQTTGKLRLPRWLLSMGMMLLKWLRTKIAMTSLSLLMAGSAAWFSISHCSSPHVYPPAPQGNHETAKDSSPSINASASPESHETAKDSSPSINASASPESHEMAKDYADRGNALLQKGDKDQAIRYLTEAIRLNPQDATLYNSRGIAYFGKGDYLRAISDFTELIRLRPDWAGAYQNRANVYHAIGKETLADSDLAEAERLKKRAKTGDAQ